jgi:hypothetical protein
MAKASRTDRERLCASSWSVIEPHLLCVSCGSVLVYRVRAVTIFFVGASKRAAGLLGRQADDRRAGRCGSGKGAIPDRLEERIGGAGSEPAAAYRRYVTAGLSKPPESPWSEAYHGWILGSQKFVDRVRAMVKQQPRRDRRRESRRVEGLSISQVSEVVCAEFGIELSELSLRGSRHPARAAMAYLARRHTAATNGELIDLLGVSRAESVPNLMRRFDAWLAGDSRIRRVLKRLEAKLTAGTPAE